MSLSDSMTVGQIIEILSQVDPSECLGEMSLKPCPTDPGYQKEGKTHHLQMIIGDRATVHFVNLKPDAASGDAPRDPPLKEGMTVEKDVDKTPQVLFVVGDVVQLKSGGPKMTVTQVGSDSEPDDIGLVWFNERGKLRVEMLPAYCLTKISPDKTRDDLEEWIFSTDPDEDRAHIQLSLLLSVCELGMPSYDQFLDLGWGDVRTRDGLEWLRQKEYIAKDEDCFQLKAKGVAFLSHWLSFREPEKSQLQKSLEIATERQRRWLRYYENGYSTLGEALRGK